MTGGRFNKTGGPKKLRGCIAASPIVPFEFVAELTSSSWLSFSLPFYSPPNFLSFTPALLAERVFNLMYSDTDLSCQEESDVRDKKNENYDARSWKIKMRGDIREDYSPKSAQYGTTIAQATTGLRTYPRRTFIRKLEAQGRWMESSLDWVYL
jgi:hypothetical protein